jgi:hypothetical protein
VTRSPLFYPLSRGGDAEAGGAADLQTDVMRFMAILSLCLVAIFALVQSIPLTPVEENPPPLVENAPSEIPRVIPEKMNIEPAPAQITAADLTRPTPTQMTKLKESVVLQRPKPTPIAHRDPEKPEPAQVTETPDASSASAEPVEKGFTLQFETDEALTRLVARQVVGFYAMSPDKSLRMNIDNDEISFWPSSVPGTFHEMDQSTVPDEVLAAYLRGNQNTDTKWGVTLPADMSRELNEHLSSTSGGSLIIASSGAINLRR